MSDLSLEKSHQENDKSNDHVNCHPGQPHNLTLSSRFNTASLILTPVVKAGKFDKQEEEVSHSKKSNASPDHSVAEEKVLLITICWSDIPQGIVNAETDHDSQNDGQDNI